MELKEKIAGREKPDRDNQGKRPEGKRGGFAEWKSNKKGRKHAFSEEDKRENTIRFIEAAKALIDEEGINNASLRKIASKAGFHNSTTYLYFDDIDELLMLASLKYFKKYSMLLSTRSDKAYTPQEDFLFIWEVFFQCFLEKPCIFSNFFFGKKSGDLTSIIDRYYRLYPEELSEFTEVIKEMYFGKNIRERSRRILEPLIECGCNVNEENIEMINELILSYCKYKLERGCSAGEDELGKIKEDTMSAIRYLAGI